MMNTRFAYVTCNTMPSPRAAGSIRNPIRHCLRTQSDIPRSHVDIPSHHRGDVGRRTRPRASDRVVR